MVLVRTERSLWEEVREARPSIKQARNWSTNVVNHPTASHTLKFAFHQPSPMLSLLTAVGVSTGLHTVVVLRETADLQGCIVKCYKATYRV